MDNRGRCKYTLFSRNAKLQEERAITKLQAESGEILRGEKRIEAEIIQFYRNLYSKDTTARWGVEGLNWEPIEEYARMKLEQPFTEEEIKQAVCMCEGNKAPGPDGYTLKVFQQGWEVVREDLLKVFEDFAAME